MNNTVILVIFTLIQVSCLKSCQTGVQDTLPKEKFLQKLEKKCFSINKLRKEKIQFESRF